MNRECEFEGAFELSGDVSAVGGDRRDMESHGSAESAGDVARDGVVKWFRIDKGYGFVALDGGVGDAFLHLKSLRAVGREFGCARRQAQRRRRAGRAGHAGHPHRRH